MRSLQALRRNLRRKINLDRSVTVLEQRFETPLICGMCCRLTEGWMLELLAQLLPRLTGSVVDVGANLGQTLLKVKAVDAGRGYFGFEPNPACLFYLSELIARNSFSDCKIVPVGIGPRTEMLELSLFTERHGEGSATLVQGFRGEASVRGRLPVPVFRPEEAGLDGAARPALIKIDVEGGELEVIQALHDCLQSSRALLLIEVLPVYTADNQTRLERQQALESVLRDLEYDGFRITKSVAGRLVGLQAMADIGIHGDLAACDYLYCPRERVVALELNTIPPGGEAT